MYIHLKGDFKTREVVLNHRELLPDESQELINHSPDGFAWGYGGSGPSQLALAVCMEVYKGESGIPKYQEFKRDHIEPLPQSDFDVIIEFKYEDYKPKG